MTALVNPGLAEELERSDEFNADACMNCGVCRVFTLEKPSLPQGAIVNFYISACMIDIAD